MASQFYQPDKDAGWGLIFRLNDLWVRADRKALAGDYDGWELTLDRIFTNLSYRNDMEVETNGDEEVVDVVISESEFKEWKIAKGKISNSKRNIKLALLKKNPKDYLSSKEEHYNALIFYDIWLRKLMRGLGLYLKEFESNPSKALFGGAFG
jgi:hypothetical protein